MLIDSRPAREWALTCISDSKHFVRWISRERSRDNIFDTPRTPEAARKE